ncbi:MAG: sugar ABC transporter ATP-binding protein [Acetobacteraceae bacterium]
MSEPALLLEASDVAKSFGAVAALRGACLEVRAGEVHALMGANGAGKSTLVKVLTGVLRPDSGTMAIRGVRRFFRSPAQARASGLASVYQDPALVPDLTIGQNLRLAGTKAGAVWSWLEQFGFGSLDLRTYIRDLPLPTLRLIDLARVLAAEPDILLLDEITAALPADLAEHVFDAMRRWRDMGRSVIFISHRLAEIAALCDRATVLRDGLTVGVVDPAAGAEEKVVSLMLGAAPEGRAADTIAVASDRRVAESAVAPALEVKHLRCGELLHDVSLSLCAGEVLGVAALEGQGQTELFDCLAGLRRPAGGSIVAHGVAQKFRHPADAIRAGLVLVPADRLRALLPQRSVRENIALPLARRLTSWGPLPLRRELREVNRAVSRLQIDTRAASEVRRLSGGNQQKVVIARWIACGFKTLLCFDPTRGIDIGTKRQIYGLVREVAAAGSAVLLFTSELPEIALACDRVVVLFGGRVVEELPASEAGEARLLRAAHGLARQADHAA